jgi:Na+/proline symporter
MKGMSYLPMVGGFLIGYFVIGYVLIPLYYKLNLTSIYAYLKTRFGIYSFKTGAVFFLISRTVGASLRLFLAAEVLDIFLFTPLGVPYFLGIILTIALIWVYTFKSGIKTIIWTDALQTACILIALGATVYFIKTDMDVSLIGLFDVVINSELFDFTGAHSPKKVSIALSVFNGVMIAIVMTGLDQDMMQKSLTCKNVGDSRKNMIWLGVILIPVNFIFLSLGVLIFENYIGNGLSVNMIPKAEFPFNIIADGASVGIPSDSIYPSLANYGYFPLWLSATFLIGLVAAAYSSADSALTSLTTSFCLDILEDEKENTRYKVHIGTSVVLVFVVLLFKLINDDSVVWLLFSWAGFTYGPLLGLFAVGIFTKVKVRDKLVPFIALGSVLISILVKNYFGLGAEVLVVNGLLTATGLFIFRENETAVKLDE